MQNFVSENHIDASGFKFDRFTVHIDQNLKYLFFSAYETIQTYVPALRSETTEGRIQIGGTRILVSIRSLGLPTSGFIITRGISYRGNKINNAMNEKNKKEKIQAPPFPL